MHLNGELLYFSQHFQVLYIERFSRIINPMYCQKHKYQLLNLFQYDVHAYIPAAQLSVRSLVTSVLFNPRDPVVYTFLDLQ